MKKTRNLKLMLRKLYKKKKQEDAEQVGRKINDLTQSLHLQMRLEEKDRDKEVLKYCVENLATLRRHNRFIEDFPSFPKFYNYIVSPKNGFTLEDVKEL